MEQCCILFPNYSHVDPQDKSGCIKPGGHFDAHLFKSTAGEMVEWEYDYDCGCDSCLNDEDGQCIIYSIIENDTCQLPA